MLRTYKRVFQSKQKSEKEQQKSYSAAPTAYNYVKPEEEAREEEARSPEIQPHEAERIVQEVKEKERLEQQRQSSAIQVSRKASKMNLRFILLKIAFADFQLKFVKIPMLC